jgi:O-antigen/teichoic acid export membrane protein
VYITGFGALITVVLNIIFIPLYSYYACAWIHLISNGLMLALTYYYGQKIYRIGYDLKKIGLYIGLGLILYTIGKLVRTEMGWLNVIVGCIIVLIYFLYCNKKEDLIGIFLKKHESKNS